MITIEGEGNPCEVSRKELRGHRGWELPSGVHLGSIQEGIESSPPPSGFNALRISSEVSRKELRAAALAGCFAAYAGSIQEGIERRQQHPVKVLVLPCEVSRKELRGWMCRHWLPASLLRSIQEGIESNPLRPKHVQTHTPKYPGRN